MPNELKISVSATGSTQDEYKGSSSSSDRALSRFNKNITQEENHSNRQNLSVILSWLNVRAHAIDSTFKSHLQWPEWYPGP